MRITTSWNYYCGDECHLSDCERHYCPEHRLLWRDCDTAKKGYDYGAHFIWEMGDCPSCERESRIKRFKEVANG